MPNKKMPRVLAAAKANNRDEDDRKLKALIDECLVPAAIKAVGNKRDQVDLQTSSIVAQVIEKELSKVLEPCNDTKHLRARLIRAVEHKVIDILRKGGVHGRAPQFSQGRRGSLPEQAVVAAGPGTQLADAESVAQAAESFDRFREVLLAHAKDTKQRVILMEYVLAGKEWVEVAPSVGLSVEAARKYLSKIRPDLLPEICKPLRPNLDGPAWAITELLFVKRFTPAKVAETLGTTEQNVESVSATRIIPEIKRLYGKNAYEGLLRLTGNKRISKSTP